MSRKRCVLVGAGGWGSAWVGRFLPAFADRLEVVGVADVRRSTLDSAAERLGVPENARFTDGATALRTVDADFCVLVVQPRFRPALVEAALESGLDVLAEKPIADSWEASVGILRAVRASGRRMAVVQNYRFLPAFEYARQLLDEEAVGPVNTISARFDVGFTPQTAGGAFRHQVPGAMLYEGSVHHFDQLRHLAAADCAWIVGRTWNPPRSGFANDPCGMFLAEMTNGVMCQYETNYVAFGEQCGWHEEHYRIECERGSITVERDGRVVVTTFDPTSRSPRTSIESYAPAKQPDSGHHRVLNDFLDWIDGGNPAPTGIEDNIATAAMTFGALASTRTGTVVDVAALQRTAATDTEIGGGR